jgi:hypothetical protein
MLGGLRLHTREMISVIVTLFLFELIEALFFIEELYLWKS